MFNQGREAGRVTLTLILLGLAGVAGVVIWNHYLTGPWTRDGQVLAYVVDLAPQVSGRVTEVHVADNQSVKKGDLLYEIEPVDFEIAVANAQATVNSRKADVDNKTAAAERRGRLTTLSTSQEEMENFRSGASMATATYAGAISQLNQARIDLDRTKVYSPVNGYVTNLQLRQGDYATKGTRTLSVLDSDSFWIVGYFEETKIAGIGVGNPAYAALMGFRDPIRGHVESIARGISTPNTQPGTQGLASVSPVFTWVRLAQRIPVRIHIDEVPPTVTIVAGMTATVTVGPGAGPNASNGLISRLLTQVGP